MDEKRMSIAFGLSIVTTLTWLSLPLVAPGARKSWSWIFPKYLSRVITSHPMDRRMVESQRNRLENPFCKAPQFQLLTAIRVHSHETTEALSLAVWTFVTYVVYFTLMDSV